MKYQIDSETREHLEALLNMAVQVAELQYDDTARDGMYTIIEQVAEQFGIPKLYIETEQEVDSEGNTHITVKTTEEEPTQDPDPDEPTTVH